MTSAVIHTKHFTSLTPPLHLVFAHYCTALWDESIAVHQNKNYISISSLLFHVSQFNKNLCAMVC